MSGPDRGLSTTSAAALVVANMIGMGVFVSAGFSLVELTRPVIIAAWVVGGVLALCGALAYGGLARRFPQSGGEYEYLRRTLHPTLGFVAGIVSLFAGFSAPVAAAAVALGTYAAPWLPSELDPRWTGSAVLVLVAVQQLAGLRLAARIQDLAVGAKLVAIVALIVGGAVVIATRDPAITREVVAGDAAKAPVPGMVAGTAVP